MSNTAWTDDRLDRALAGLADVVDFGPPIAPDSHSLDAVARARARPLNTRARSSRIGWAAAAVAIVAAGAALVPAGRAAVTDWLGIGTVRVHRTVDGPGVGAGRLIDDLSPLDPAEALTELGPIADRFDAAGLGPPDAIGRPPEGGVVLVWNGVDDGAVSLWSSSIDDAFQLGKFGTAGVDIEPLPSINPTAILIDGRHELWTPIRTVTAERVIWWEDQQRQYRLEADLPAEELIAIAEALAS